MIYNEQAYRLEKQRIDFMGKQVKENQRGVSFDRILFIKRLLILLAGLSIFSVLWLSIAFLNDELNFTANETGLQDLYVTHISQGSAKKMQMS